MTTDSRGNVLNQLKNRLEIASKQPKTANNCIRAIQKASLKNTKPIDIGIIDQRLLSRELLQV
jgi:hypothetical protein